MKKRLIDESAVLRPLSWHLILYVFRYFHESGKKYLTANALT